MEINNLFGGGSAQGKAQKEENLPQYVVKNVCAHQELNVRPLLYGLEKGLVEHDFKLKYDTPQSCTRKLIQGEAELALIPSIEYAKGKGAWKIVPELCIASQGLAGNMVLFFNKNLHTLRRVAVDERYPTAITLLQIILREKYEMEPELISMRGDLPEMLQQADAVLLSGDRALETQAEIPSYLDLSEEWYDLTGLPFVSAFWAGHEISLTEKEVKILQQSAEIGRKNNEKISKEFAGSHAQNFEFYKEYLVERIHYFLGQAEVEGLTEFFNYAFYLGLIEHIPDLHFFGSEDE